jgi:hypothetical protein
MVCLKPIYHVGHTVANKKTELLFTIPETTPHILPMARLADYLRKLAILFGHENHVHFLKMKDGSATAVAEMDEEIAPLIVDRTRKAAEGEGVQEAIEGFESVKEMLEDDGYTAAITRNGDVIAKFVRHLNEESEAIGPIWQEGTLDGLLVRIEGV